MKKSLIALAALATVATAAQAQSSVTIYGVVDVGYGSIDHVANVAGNADKRVSGLQNGGLSTSRLGFRGVEDLGGGLKAGFTLESEFLADTGGQTSTPEALFARESSVFLEGSAGKVRLGRFNSLSYDLAARFDPMGANNIGGAIGTSQYGYVRLENSVEYTTPTFNGLKARLQTGTRTAGASTDGTVPSNAGAKSYGEVAGDTGANRNNAVSLEYSAGKLELAATYGTQKNSIGAKESDVTSLFARYDFGFARLAAGYIQQDTDPQTNGVAGYTATATAKKAKKTFVGANVPVTAAVTVNAYVQQVVNETVGSADTKPWVYTLGANYALSKRTTLYAITAWSNQDNGSSQGIVNAGKWNYHNTSGALVNGAAPVAGKDQTAYAVGIRHTF